MNEQVLETAVFVAVQVSYLLTWFWFLTVGRAWDENASPNRLFLAGLVFVWGYVAVLGWSVQIIT